MKKNLQDIKLFIFDLDGTIYIGNREIEGSFDAVRKLKEMGKKICFFTNNSSRSYKEYIKKFADMGLEITEDEIYTSGQATCEWLLENHPKKKVFLLGNPSIQAEFKTYGIELDEDNPDICVVAFDTSLEYSRVYKFCNKLFNNRDMLYVATHPDKSCPAPECPMPDIGAIISLIYDTIQRQPDVIIGKPFETAGEIIRKRFGVGSKEVAMVGDRLSTDIDFGNRCGFSTILVLSGETSMEDVKKSKVRAKYILKYVKEILENV